MTTRGICYIAIGDKAQAEADRSAASLRDVGIDLPMTVCTSATAKCLETGCGAKSDDPVSLSRWCKVNLDLWTPYDQTLYLDADTHAYSSDLLKGFAILSNGWDICITLSANQSREWLWHTTPADRLQTANAVGFHGVQWQCGVFWFAKNGYTAHLFDWWRDEWLEHAGQDQGAFMRALRWCPLRLWVLGQSFNGGSVLAHYFGRLRA
jgi:hypothetical protein